MPPAFNLSQDQTLQFNLCLQLQLIKNHRVPTLLQAGTTINFSMSTQYQSIRQDPKAPAPNQSSTHTYRLFRLLKNKAAEQRKPRIIQIEKCGSRLLRNYFRRSHNDTETVVVTRGKYEQICACRLGEPRSSRALKPMSDRSLSPHRVARHPARSCAVPPTCCRSSRLA